MLEELKTFMQVVNYENFTKAAKKVNLSQPTVSLHIKRLEQYFNTTLIERSSKSKQVIITKQGKLLYERGQEIIKQIEDVKMAIACSENQVGGQLIVGASKTIGEHFLPKILKAFSDKYPHLHIEVMIENTANVCEKVKERQVDIGIIEGTDPHYDFERGYICGDKMVLAVSNDSHLIAEPRLMEALQDQVWISREAGSGTQEYLESFLEENTIKPKNKMVFNSNFAVQEAVKNGLGITLISEYVVGHAVADKEITVLPLDEECTRKFSYILPKHTEVTPATAAFMEVLKELR
ncbi:MAG: LysR substrate-binding domain-containing protein [Cellulosilyticaceae bacterium]